MEAQPPLMALAEQEEEAEPSLDEQFAHILHLLMSDDISAATAIQAFEKTSVGIMQQYREASSALLHRAAHYLHTRRLASELEGQAASWQLLHTLYCSGETPAGSGIAGAADVGGQPTLTQITANAVNQRDDLRRTAQVVCWLETLAAQRLQEAHTSRFAHHEGLWRETLMTSGGSGLRSGPVVELDPDAPSRDKVKLALGDRQGEERLAAQLWQLIRAGKLRDARQLCCQAGAAWRCLSLGGGGEWGPLPVGAPAAEAAEEIDQQAAADELSWQVEGGLATNRIAWKWACYAAAEAAANAIPGNRWEAAVYAALCGHVARMLPVCSTWEDELWAYCRAWLDLSTDALLLNEVNEDRRASDYMLGARGEDMVSPELLMGCVGQAASSGYSSAADVDLLNEGLSAITGDWPKNGLLGDSERVTVPRNFTELAQLVANSSNSTVRGEARQQQHVLQLLTMSSDWLALTNELAQAALAAAEQLQQLQQGLGQQQDGQLHQQQDDGDDAQMEDEGLVGEDEGVRAMSAESAAGVLRFAAHWALCLRALGLVQDHSWITDEQEEAETAKLQTVLGKVIYQYALHLAQQPGTLCLVPAYLCHLRLGLRESLIEALLTSATDIADDEACQALYLQLVAASEEWLARQQRLIVLVLDQGVQPGAWWDVDEEAEDGNRRPSSCLFGDLRPQEVRLLLQQLLSRGFATPTTSPVQRCQQLRWAFYSFTGAMAAQQQQLLAATGAEASGPDLTLSAVLPWQDIWGDALNYALVLASELALNPGFGSAGLQVLLGQVVPASFLETVSRVAADQLVGDAAQQLQVQRQLLALAFWQRYVDLDARYQQWRELWAAALAGGDVSGSDGSMLGAASLLGEVAEQGQQLVAEMLQLALDDCLRLPAPVELVQLLLGDSEGAGSAGAGSSIPAEGEWLALPKYDDEEKPTELVLALSVVRGSAAGADEVDGAAGDAADPELPFVQLEEREADRLRQKISAFLAAATATTPDVTAEASVIDDPSHNLAGTVAVRITSFEDSMDPSGLEADRARLQRRMTKAWQDMVDIAAHLLSSSSGVGSATAAAAAAAGGGMPRLALVHMTASISTRLALCRHRSTSKLLRRSGKVLLDLARAGHPSNQLDVLIHAAGDAGGRDGPQLLGLLSPSDAGKLLVCLEQIIEEGGMLEEEDLLLQE